MMAVITIAAGADAQCERQQCATNQVAAGADTDRKVDHLGREHERAHHAQQRNAGIVQLPSGPLNHEPNGGNAQGVQSGPYGRGQKIVRDMHSTDASK